MDRSIEGSCAHLGAVKLNSVGWEHFRDHLDGRKVNQSPVPSRRGDVKNSPVSLSSVVQKQGYAFVSQHHKLNLNIPIVVRDRASASVEDLLADASASAPWRAAFRIPEPSQL